MNELLTKDNKPPDLAESKRRIESRNFDAY